MGEVVLPQLLAIDVIVDIDSFAANVSPQFLNHLAWHPSAPEVSGEPMPAAMRTEVIFNSAKLAFSDSGFEHQQDYKFISDINHRIDEQGGVLYRYDFMGLDLPIGLITRISFIWVWMYSLSFSLSFSSLSSSIAVEEIFLFGRIALSSRTDSIIERRYLERGVPVFSASF